MKKTILIIGANAAFAQAVIPVLAKKHTIITAGKKGCDVHCDITKPVTIPHDVDVVINFAASFGGNSDEEIAVTLDTNVLGTLRICEAAKKAGVRHIVSISSIFAVLDEASPSYSIYALTKKQADELARFYCRLNQIPLTILRPSRIYGDTDTFAKNQPFLYHIIGKAQLGEDISIYGQNDASRNYIHAADLAEIIARVIADQVEGTFDCVYPSNSTYAHIARAAQEIFDRGGRVSFLKDKPDIPDDLLPLDPALYEKIGFYPRISIEAGVQRIKNYREKEPA